MPRNGLPDPTHNITQVFLARGRVIKRPFRWSDKLVALGPASQGYRFFTPAYLYLYTALPDQVLVDFAASQREDVVFGEGTFETPLFKGLDHGDSGPVWNYKLWTIEERFWEAFQVFVSSVVLVQHRGRVSSSWLTTYAALTILDPVYRQKNRLVTSLSDLPTLDIGVFGLLSGSRRLYLQPGKSLFDLPQSCWTDGDPQIRRLDRAVSDPRATQQSLLSAVEQSHDKGKPSA